MVCTGRKFVVTFLVVVAFLCFDDQPTSSRTVIHADPFDADNKFCRQDCGYVAYCIG
jgi:hypothetical protein